MVQSEQQECVLDKGGFSIGNWILWCAEQWSPKENHILIFEACECLCYMAQENQGRR
jgi:hypothetical protein